MTKENYYTWQQLKDFCNTLDEDQLKNIVSIWGDEEGFKLKGTQLLEDDFFNPSGEGLEPTGVYKQNPEDWEEVKDEPIIFAKNTPILTIV